MPNITPSRDTIFCEAVEIADPAARADYLDRVCGDDGTLRKEVESLVEAHFEAGRAFLESPAGGGLAETATVDANEDTPHLGAEIGPYKLRELIGEGGMGLVYVAEQVEPVRRKVALKLIKPGMDSRQVVARFEAERQALALMDHPNIARILDAGTTERGCPYFVMELVKGTPITAFCDAQRLTIRKRLELFLQVCRAVQHAHQKGVIHRDLKPSNILISVHDVTLVAKVIDFGIAKAVGQSLTDRTLYTGLAQLIGTPLYMSPEQAGQSSLDVDTRTDVYSLGVLLYELLTGTTPFGRDRLQSEGLDEFRRVVREEEPVRPSDRLSTLALAAQPTVADHRVADVRQLTRQVRGDLDWLVMKCLEKDRNRRYESIGALAADVQRYLDDDPVLARPPSLTYRLRRWARRHQTVFWSAGACLLVAGMVLAGSVGWVARDRAAWQAEADARAEEALGEAERLARGGDWAATREATKRAEGLLARGGSPGLRRRAEEWQNDLKMLLRLEEIRTLEAMTAFIDQNRQRIPREYAAAFRNYGIDVENLTWELAADQIRARSIRSELATTLDHWAASLIRGHADRQLPRKLMSVAQEVDPDPFHDVARRYLVTGRSEEIFKLIVTQPPPIRTLALLTAVQLSPNKELEDLVRQTVRRHPGDFWLNLYLARVLPNRLPPLREEAIQHATAAVAIRPNSAAAHFTLGVALSSKKQWNEAIIALETSVRLGPDIATSYAKLGECLEEVGRIDEAIAAYRGYVRLVPGDSNPRNELAVLLARKGLLDEAIATYTVVGDGTLLNRPGGHKAAAGKHLAAYDLGYRLLRHDKALALAAFRKAVELMADFADAQLAIGTVLFNTGKWEEGIAATTRAIELDPKWDHAWRTRAEQFVKQHEFSKAVADFKKVTELHREDLFAQHSLGCVLNRLGRHDEAVTALRKAIEQEGKLKWRFPAFAAECYHELGIALAEKGDLNRALESLDKAVELSSDGDKPHRKPRYHESRAWILMRQNKRPQAFQAFQKAIEAANKAIELAPNNADAFNDLGWLLATCFEPHFRDATKAVQHARRATALSPNKGAYWNTLGVAEYRAGDWKAAVQSLEKSMTLRNGGDAFDRYFLAMARWRLGEKDEARRLYDQANAWVEKNLPRDKELLRFRAEAAELLGLLTPPPLPSVGR